MSVWELGVFVVFLLKIFVFTVLFFFCLLEVEVVLGERVRFLVRCCLGSSGVGFVAER